MKIVKKCLVCLFLCLSYYFSFGQESFGGEPYSFNRYILSNSVPVMELPKIDNAQLKAEDKSSDRGVYRVSIVQPVDYTMENSGRVDKLPGGGSIWRLAVKSENAYFIELTFSKFIIPEGAELFIYNPSRSFVIGKFTSASALDDNKFYAQAIPGDEVIIEYYEPQDADFKGVLELGKVIHGYRDIFKITKGQGDSGPCEINVVCPEGDAWRDQINSVVCISISTATEGFLCSGAMINNVRQDKKKYVYTAWHCYEGDPASVDFRFYFNYETDACNGTTGISNKTATGAAIRARDNMYSSSDFMLLEITGGFGVSIRDKIYYAGWDRSTSAPTVGAAIHHPEGDWKKISLPQGISASGNYWSVGWRTTNNKGVTEQGSSGSPLFNGSKLIVGSLSNGSSSCSTLSGRDNYGKLSHSWTNNNNTSTAKKLQPWLDPDNTGATTVPGIYYMEEVGIKEPAQDVKSLGISPNPTTGSVILKGEFSAVSGQCKVFSVLGELVYNEPLNLTDEVKLDLASLKTGVYLVEIVSGKEVFRSKLVISK